ncbi:MAG TPA: outer membrane protein assembly factor BamD [Candidatus Acidoferrum sp.]|nr:outer membrane protein assembly factor BamD [Candidatus Acidoferrum sp.]
MNRTFAAAILSLLLAGPLSLSARGQAVQAQTGSSGQSQQPAQAQNPPAQDQTPPDQPKKDQPKKDQKQPRQKKIKAHVVKADTKADKKKAADEAVDTTQTVEPDKVLYERAMFDVKKGKYTEARLTLQALINTYPDSEYLAKAKLGVADSYYKEGGTSNLTQAIDEYKNFIIFFPFLDEAAYAQMQIGMGHFRMMEKSDRDTTQAIEAEQEFQTFLLKYPQSPLISKAEQYLRDAQEVLADGEYKIARFYYVKQDYPASAARLIELSQRYPLYSQSDEALWMLGDVYSLAKARSRNEDDKNHWADLAAKCYDRIVQEYPLSDRAPQAKDRLKALGMPVPAANPEAVARMQKEQAFQKEHHQTAVLRLPIHMLKSSPPVEDAAHSGEPNLQPPNDAISAREVLKQGAQGPDFTAQTRPAQDQNQAPIDSGTPVEATTAPPISNAEGSNVGVQIISTGSPDSTPPASSQPAPGTAGNPPATNPTPAATQPPPPDAVPAAASGGTTGPASVAPVTGTSGQSAPQTAAQAKDQTPLKSDKADPKTESTSKKKKGLKKLIPW